MSLPCPAKPSPRHVLLVALVALSVCGCVRRRLTVRSNPAGAVVHVDNQRIGTTPCSVDYVYYGTREIRLSAPGYETLTVNQPLPAPWYETPGLDFISENLVPNRIEDSRTVSFNLQRTRLEPPEQVIARGEQLRQQATPLGAAPVVPAAASSPLPGAFGARLPVPTPPPAGTPTLAPPAPTNTFGPPPAAPVQDFRY